MSGEFVFGDFPDVENSKNSDSLDFLVLLDQAKRTFKRIKYKFRLFFLR
jgi:hypothetical protein